MCGWRPAPVRSAKRQPPRPKERPDGARRGEKPGRSKPQPTSYDDGPRVQINRARDEEGEWIRSSEVSNDDGGRKRSGDRGDRGDPAATSLSVIARPSRGDRPVVTTCW
jgi:23S rRNA pseudouridine2605 synthase